MEGNEKILQHLTRFTLSPVEVEQVNVYLATVSDWNDLLRQVELYAISSLFLRHVKQHSLAVPSDVQLSLKGLAIRHRLVAQARYQTIKEIQSSFTKNNISFIALKGLALAPMIYPEATLRPMRDMDILVPRDKEALAGELLVELGFFLPQHQPSKYMRDTHQLPNATKKVNGFTISVEVHHDALSRDVEGHLFYEDIISNSQAVVWDELTLLTLGHEQMLHQVAKHMAGLHPGAILKLINVMDVVAYAEKYIDEIDWVVIEKDYKHVINSLKCLHLIMPLSDRLQTVVGGVDPVEINGVGEIMQPLSYIMGNKKHKKKMLQQLFLPSDWWLYLYYSCDPSKSLFMIKLVRHPLTIFKWLTSRVLSRLMGG